MLCPPLRWSRTCGATQGLAQNVFLIHGKVPQPCRAACCVDAAQRQAPTQQPLTGMHAVRACRDQNYIAASANPLCVHAG